MGCNCKKKNEQVARKYYVPATETEPAHIIESVIDNSIPQTPDELLAQELNEWNGGNPKPDCPDCDFKITVEVKKDNNG